VRPEDVGDGPTRHTQEGAARHSAEEAAKNPAGNIGCEGDEEVEGDEEQEGENVDCEGRREWQTTAVSTRRTTKRTRSEVLTRTAAVELAHRTEEEGADAEAEDEEGQAEDCNLGGGAELRLSARVAEGDRTARAGHTCRTK